MHRSLKSAARIVALALFAVVSIRVGAARAGAAALNVNGEVKTRLALSGADLAAMQRAKAAVTDDNGAKAVYEGVPVIEFLKRAGAPLGKELRGPNMTMCVIASAADGYKVVFALAEFDPGFIDQVILLADHRDGHPLNALEGPLRLIVPNDKRHARWVRDITTLTLKNAR